MPDPQSQTRRRDTYNLTVMKKKKKGFTYLSKEKEDLSAKARERKKEAFQKNKKYLFPLLMNTVLFYGVYAVLNNTPACTAVMWTYFALLLGFSVAYIVYNQGFFRKNLTPDQLPSGMSDQEKQDFLDEGKRRMDKSKWMITVIFPLVMTFVIDMAILFVLEPLMQTLGM